MNEIVKRGTPESPNSIEIRPVQEGDLGPLADIFVEVYTVFGVGEKWNKKSAQEMLGYWFKHYPDLASVAEYDTRIVGAFLAGVKPWWDGNHLVDGEIFIHPNYQKKGIGTHLTREMFKAAREKYGVVAWDTYTFKGFKHPLSWYRKLGFEEIKEWTMISGNIREALRRLGD